MLFNSPLYFLLFLPISVVVYFQLTRFRSENLSTLWLIAASFFFYGYWNWSYVPLLLLSILGNYALGRYLVSFQPALLTLSRQSRLIRKAVYLGGILANVSLLGYFKYTDFLLVNINQLIGAGIPVQEIVLPLAISFFTFQQIAYLVDSYNGQVEQKGFLTYMLFVSFFPQLIAGPIVHHKSMMPQFTAPKAKYADWDNISTGAIIFIFGLFKKLFIADSFALWADAGFDGTGTLGLLDAWVATLSYTLQIYYDFSGYSDMAIGAGLILNIRLPVNFDSPYKATSIREFWRRWHITLSSWLRDYLYLPLGGNRRGARRTYVNLITTFLVGGLWHGAGWTFIIWGAMHGALLSLERAWTAHGLRLPPKWVRHGLTLVCVHLAWVFFRATSLERAGQVLAGLMGMNGVGSIEKYPSSFSDVSLWMAGPLLPEVFRNNFYVEVGLMLGVFTIVAAKAPNVLEMTGYLNRDTPLRFAYNLRWTVFFVVIAAVSVSIALVGRQNEFLYFQF